MWYKLKRIMMRPNGVEKQVRPVNWDNLDISTATLSKQYSTWYGFQWLYINPNENVALTASFGNPNGTIRGYSYSSKDISTASLTLWNKTSPQAHSVFANSTWTHIYSWKHGFGNYSAWWIYEYSTTWWNVGSMTSYRTLSPWHWIQTVWVNQAETYAICFGAAPDATLYVYVYEISTPWDISSATEIKAISCAKNLHWLFFNDEMTKCVACEYNSSSWTVYQYDRDILNSSSFPSTPTHSFWPVWFTIGYANINESWTTLYAARENGYIYQYTLS